MLQENASMVIRTGIRICLKIVQTSQVSAFNRISRNCFVITDRREVSSFDQTLCELLEIQQLVLVVHGQLQCELCLPCLAVGLRNQSHISVITNKYHLYFTHVRVLENWFLSFNSLM